MRIIEAAFLVPAPQQELISGGAVAVRGDRIAAIGTATELRARFPQASVTTLPDAALLPGLINAHQHGRGLSQLQLGYPDDALEPWQNRRRSRGAPDSFALTRLAAAQMLANGVTSTVHAPYSYASGDYEAEIRGVVRAYEQAGIRATVCLGFSDRGGLVYPPTDEADFRASLSAPSRTLLERGKPAYLSLERTIDLMRRLLDEYAGHQTISFAYGPSVSHLVSDEAWRMLIRDANQRGVGIHFHCLESPATAQSHRHLYPEGFFQRLQAFGAAEARLSAAHFVHASLYDIEMAAALGVVIVANPGSNMRLYNGAPPLSAWIAAGVDIALGTDNCALDDNEDYLSELRLGGLIARSPQNHSQSIAADRLLEIGTLAGGRAAFLNSVGALREGHKADLIALDISRVRGAYLDPDADLLRVILARATGSDISLVMVNGVERHSSEASALTSEILAQARSAAFSARTSGPGAAEAAEQIADRLRAHYYPDAIRS